MCSAIGVPHNLLVKLISKEKAFSVYCRTKKSKLEGSIFLKWAFIAPIKFFVSYMPSDCPS